MNKNAIDKLFVYGTLAPGKPNEHILNNIGGTFKEAMVKGTLHQAGWGAALGYPGIMLSEGGEQVKGYLFSSDNIAKHWKALDEFEGEAYQRVCTTVQLLNGSTVQAFIYTLKAQ